MIHLYNYAVNALCLCWDFYYTVPSHPIYEYKLLLIDH